MDRNVCFVIFFVFTILTARDMIYKWGEAAEQNPADTNQVDNVQKEIPNMSFRQSSNGPTIKVLYCYSCGYQQAFDEYQRMINERFPSITVIGSNYSPGFIKSKLVQFFSLSKMIVIGLLMTNVNPFAHFGVNTPRIWIWMTEHKVKKISFNDIINDLTKSFI